MLANLFCLHLSAGDGKLELMQYGGAAGSQGPGHWRSAGWCPRGGDTQRVASAGPEV